MTVIQYHNSLTGKTETEQVYGEGFLRFAYGNPLGKAALHAFIKRPFFSHWYGRRMSDPSSRERILPFIEKFQLDPTEFADAPESYASFNEFFYRKLKPASRPIDAAPNSVIFPADGRHLAFPRASAIKNVFVKGQRFNIEKLFDSAALASRYQHGSLLLSRLCPVDYHRFHFPIAGTPAATTEINGPLFSVSPIALAKNLSYFWQNKRTITTIKTEQCGTVIMLEIGATCVGSIHQTYQANQPIEKGAEKGYFAFGGSSTILLFEPDAITIDPALVARSAQSLETYARIGMPFAHIKSPTATS